MDERDYKPSTYVSLHVWDADIKVERTEYPDISVIKLSIGTDHDITIVFDSLESEAQFFDAIAAVRPAEKPSEQVA